MTLHVSNSFSVHHQESSTVNTAIDITCMSNTYGCVYSGRVLVMDRETVRNMECHIPKIHLRK